MPNNMPFFPSDETIVMDMPNSPRQAADAASLTFMGGENYNLPFPSPHVQDEFVWGAPPVNDSNLSVYNTQNNFSPVGTVTLSVKVPGTQITLGTFPSSQRVASVLFKSNSGLLSVDIIAAINNLSNNGEIGCFVAQDVGAVLGLASSANVYDGILAPLGQYSKRSGASFSLDIAPLIKQNTGIAIYVVGYGTNLATSSIAVTVILRYANLDG